MKKKVISLLLVGAYTYIYLWAQWLAAVAAAMLTAIHLHRQRAMEADLQQDHM